jgi:hypothetical protein
LRLIRAAIGNAVVWGGLWFIGTLVVFSLVKIAGLAPRGAPWGDVLDLALRSSVLGAIASATFSAFIAIFYRGRRLSDLSWMRFGLGGAVLVGLFVPLFMITVRFFSGDSPLSLGNLVSNAMIGAFFGGVASAGSLKLAQLADRFVSISPREQRALPEGVADNPLSSSDLRERVDRE